MLHRSLRLFAWVAVSALAPAFVLGLEASLAPRVELRPEGTPVELPLHWSATSSLTPFDAGRLVTQDSAGNVYMAGTTVGDAFNLTKDMLFVKYDPEGQVVWTRTWRGYPEAAADDIPNHLKWSVDGTLVVVGDAGSVGGPPNLCVLEIDPEGTILWSRIWSNPFDQAGFGHGSGKRVDIAPDGSIYAMAGNFELVKYSSDGTLVWGKKDPFINYADWRFHESVSLAVDAAGNAFVAGWTRALGTNSSAFTAVAYTAQGATLWTTRTTDLFRTMGMVLDGVGNLYAVGSPTPTSTSESVLVKHSTDGGARLFRLPVTFQGDGIAAVQLVRDAFDRPVLLGFRNSAAHTMVFDPNGQPIWGVTNPTMAPIRMNANAWGDIAVVGSVGVGFDTGFKVVVYSGTGQEYGSAVFDELGTSEVPAWVDAGASYVNVAGEIRPPVPQTNPVLAMTRSYLFQAPAPIFADGFENGDTLPWSATVP